MLVAVDGVKDDPDQEPESEAFPRLFRQSDHDEQARGDPERSNNPDERHLERTCAVGLLDAQDQHAGADQREREQGPDVGQVVRLAASPIIDATATRMPVMSVAV